MNNILYVNKNYYIRKLQLFMKIKNVDHAQGKI